MPATGMITCMPASIGDTARNNTLAGDAGADYLCVRVRARQRPCTADSGTKIDNLVA
jgi:hypothetical protein